MFAPDALLWLWIFMVVFNAALVAFIAWLVRFQVRFHHAAWREDGAPPPTGAVVFYPPPFARPA